MCVCVCVEGGGGGGGVFIHLSVAEQSLKVCSHLVLSFNQLGSLLSQLTAEAHNLEC